MKGCFMFRWEGRGCFLDGDFIFKWGGGGGCTHGGIDFDGGFSKINGGHPDMLPPPLWETLKGMHSTARIAFMEGKLF